MTNPGATSLILTVIVQAKTKKKYHKVFSRCHIYRDPLKTSPALVSFQIKSSSAVVASAVFGKKKKTLRGREQNSTYLVRGERRTESTAEPHAQPSQPQSSTNDSKKKKKKTKNNSERSRFILQDEGIGGAASIRAERLRGCDGVSSAAA